MGQVLIPHKGGITKNGSFDVIFHFHGHEPIRKEFVKAARGIVLVGIDLGIGSGAYSNGFASPNTFTNLLASVESVVAKHAGLKTPRPARSPSLPGARATAPPPRSSSRPAGKASTP